MTLGVVTTLSLSTKLLYQAVDYDQKQRAKSLAEKIFKELG